MRPCPKPLSDAKVLVGFQDMFRGIRNSAIALAEYGPAQPAPKLSCPTGGTLLTEDGDLNKELSLANSEFSSVIAAAILVTVRYSFFILQKRGGLVHGVR